MKQIAQNYKTGELSVLDVPVPACKPGGVLVRTEFSLISAGTEMMKVQESKLSLVGKARARPDQVKKVLESILADIDLGEGEQVVTFGDGPVEIQETRKRNGLAVGVASDEVRRYGLNQGKRSRLIQAGADLIVADFSQTATLLELLFPKTEG